MTPRHYSIQEREWQRQECIDKVEPDEFGRQAEGEHDVDNFINDDGFDLVEDVSIFWLDIL